MIKPNSIVELSEIEVPAEVNVDATSVAATFMLPDRSWETIIDNFHTNGKGRRFPLTAIQCKAIIEYVARGIPPMYIFKTLGMSHQRYAGMRTRYAELEDRIEYLRSKPELSQQERTELYETLAHPVRILISDIDRAEGLADIKDWEKFNFLAEKNPDMQTTKMKARFKDMFGSQSQEGANVNVQINLGGDFIKDI